MLLRFAGPCLTFAWLTLSAAAPAAAQAMPCPELTRVGVSALGYSSFEEGGKLRGASVDLTEALGRRSGCKVKIALFPRNRLFAELARGNIDIAMAAVPNPERDQAGVFIQYGYAAFDLLLSTRLNEKYRSLADFVARGSARLNLPRGSAFPPEVERLIVQLDQAGRLERVADYSVAFNKIAIGRADGTICTPVFYQWHFKHSDVGQQMQVMHLQRQPLGMYLSRKTLSAAQRSGYQRTVQAMTRDGVPAALYGRYLDATAMARMFGNAATP